MGLFLLTESSLQIRRNGLDDGVHLKIWKAKPAMTELSAYGNLHMITRARFFYSKNKKFVNG